MEKLQGLQGHGTTKVHTESPSRHKSFTMPAYLDSVGAMSYIGTIFSEKQRALTGSGTGQSRASAKKIDRRMNCFSAARLPTPAGDTHLLGDFVFTPRAG